jgi:hypothetical protein
MIEPDRVEKILIDCLFTADELPQENPTKEDLPADAVIAEGILSTFAFHPGRLESYRDEVKGMLDQLPVTFRATDEGGEGGWSSLNACVVRDRENPDLAFERMEQWTGLHARVDQLFSLGQALGYVKPQLPRSMWGMFPGGMPYYIVTLGVHV